MSSKTSQGKAIGLTACWSSTPISAVSWPSGTVHRLADCRAIEHHRAVGVTVVLTVVIGLWVRTAMTSTPPVMVPPGRTGVRKAQLTFEQHRSSPGSFGDNGIEDGAGNTALNDHLAEAGRLGGGLVVVQGIAVAADTREQGYVVVTDGEGQLRGLPDDRGDAN